MTDNKIDELLRKKKELAEKKDPLEEKAKILKKHKLSSNGAGPFVAGENEDDMTPEEAEELNKKFHKKRGVDSRVQAAKEFMQQTR